MYCLSHFITCGQDGDIHVFETKSDQVEHIRCSDQCYCIAVHVSSFELSFQAKFFTLIFNSIEKDYHLFIGTNRNELEVRSFPHGDSLPSLIHLTQPVSALYLADSLLFVGTR